MSILNVIALERIVFDFNVPIWWAQKNLVLMDKMKKPNKGKIIDL